MGNGCYGSTQPVQANDTIVHIKTPNQLETPSIQKIQILETPQNLVKNETLLAPQNKYTPVKSIQQKLTAFPRIEADEMSVTNDIKDQELESSFIKILSEQVCFDKNTKMNLELLENEDPISDRVMSMKLETVKNVQQFQENKSLSAKELQECIKFELISEQSSISTTSSRSIACGIRINVKQIQQKDRIPMDLVCVIDDSGSMEGIKAQLVRKSLKYLLKIMNEEDRISLVKFDNISQILTPFLRNNEINKTVLKKGIQSIQGNGSTNIEAGMEAGLWMINNRKMKNPVTCLFLLSDGEDDKENVGDRVQKLIEKYSIQDTFIINSYGYGASHDPTQLKQIAKANKGGYYYIEDINKVSEWFILSLSGLFKVIGENVKIKLKSKNDALTSLVISQLYGGDQIWTKQNKQKGEFEIHLPHLVAGEEKYFIFEAQFDHTHFLLEDSSRNLIAFQAELEVKAVKQEQIIRINTNLGFEYKEEDHSKISRNSDKDYYEELQVTKQRAIGGKIIKQAMYLMNDTNDFLGAKTILQQYQKSQQEELLQVGILESNKGIQHLNQDIEQAIQKCQPSLFRRSSFEKMEDVHCEQQQSICHMEDWNEEQQDFMNQFEKNELNLSDDSHAFFDNNDIEDNDKQSYQSYKSRVAFKAKKHINQNPFILSERIDQQNLKFKQNNKITQQYYLEGEDQDSN